MKFSNYTRTKIAWEIRKGFSLEEIQKSHPLLQISRSDVLEIKEKSRICKYLETSEGLKKFCKNCGVPRLYTEEFFGKNKEGKNGLYSICKICINIISKNKYLIKTRTDPNYRKKRLEYQKKYFEKYPERYKESLEKRKEKYHNDIEYNINRRRKNRISKRKSRENKKKILQIEKNI